MKRPILHFAPEKNWMNDPNGTFFHNGVYHLFYQYNPDGSDWGNIQWAYATGNDLVNWERKGLKLTPDTANGERYCFSGCSVVLEDKVKLFYTSIGFEEDAVQHHAKQVICDSDLCMERIVRVAEITDKLHDFPVAEWRDPFVFAYKGARYMVLAGVSDESHVFLYKATDETLNAWEYVGELFGESADIIECPNVAIFGDTFVLIYSLMHGNTVKYASGRFDGKTLQVLAEGHIDHGVNCFYATNLSDDGKGGKILYGWHKESLIGTSSPDGTYSGCLAMPKEMWVDGYIPKYRFADMSSVTGAALPVTTDTMQTVCETELQTARISFQAAGDCSFSLLENGQEGIHCTLTDGRLTVKRSSQTEADERELSVQVGKENTMDILVDGTIVEMLLNNERALSFRFYPQAETKILFRGDGNCKQVKITALKAAKIK